MMTLSIRKAQADDAGRLSDIADAAYRPYIQRIGRKPAPMDADFSYHIAHDTVFVAAAGQDAPVAGYAVLIEKPDGFWLENIAVIPEMAGQGIGRALISFIERYLSECTETLQLYTNVKMTENRNWYHRLGFTETGHGEEDGFTRVYFMKILSS